MILCVSVPCCCLATQSCPSLCDLHGLYSTPGFAVHGISQQEYWSGLPFPSTGYLSSSGIDSRLLHWQVDSLPLYHWGNHVPSVQFSCSVMSESLRPHERSTPGLPVHYHLPELLRLTSIESVMPSSHLILGHPLLLLSPIPPSIGVFSNGSTLLMRWPKYWSFRFSILLPR